LHISVQESSMITTGPSSI
nr:immunoglobulin heavy chain junction region [Mus musculus]